MKSFFAKEVLAHPLVLGACGVVAVIAAGSGWYYYSNTQAPSQAVVASLNQVATTSITASGSVVPSQNPDLSFESSGRVATVSVSVGQTVSKGQFLASLDTASLSASRDQAAANLRAAQAKLDLLKAGPRSVDVSAKQTAVAQAEQSLANLYAQVPNDLSAAYSNNLGAVHAYTDSLYNNPDTQPTLVFSTNDSQLMSDAATQRTAVTALLSQWSSKVSSPSTDTAVLDQALSDSITKLIALRAFANVLTEAVGSAITNTTFTSTSVTTANTNLASLRASISASLSTLQADVQQIASAKLAVTSANDALAQVQAGATQQDIEAQAAVVDAAAANLSAAQAALGNAVIVAPFSGTVAAVRIKVGDLAAPTLPAISLTPQSALQIEAYLSEAATGAVAIGDTAQVTLDAYGSGRTFAATVVSVDRAPTLQGNVPAYKVTLQFTQNDPAIASGMTANVIISPTH